MHNRPEILTVIPANVAGLLFATVLSYPKLAHAAASRLERHSLKLRQWMRILAFLNGCRRPRLCWSTNDSA